jgi:hypothetical protein
MPANTAVLYRRAPPLFFLILFKPVKIPMASTMMLNMPEIARDLSGGITLFRKANDKSSQRLTEIPVKSPNFKIGFI